MGAVMGRVAMMGMTGTTVGATEAVCSDIACTEADCIAVEHVNPLRNCNLTEGGQCTCHHYNGSLCNVTCSICSNRTDL